MAPPGHVAVAALPHHLVEGRLPIASIGRLFFAVAIVAFGVQHMAHGDFVTRVVPWWPDWIPGRLALVHALGIALVAAGLAILVGRAVRAVATALGLLLLLSFLLLGLPLAAADSVLGGFWTTAGKALALGGGALLVAGTTLATAAAPIWQRRLWSLGPWFFGAFLTLCGIQHFVHVEFVTSLVPAWIPGALVWTYVTGVALIAGGLGVVVPWTARVAGLLSALMIFIWVIVLHIPRAATAPPGNTNEMTAVFEALAMSGIALLVAAARARSMRS